jgi:tetratricopeptide (TPR) repeat protein
LEAIEAICAGRPMAPFAGGLLEALNGLVNKSLVWRREDGDAQPRFGMLETILEYAESCLQASGELEALQQRHAYYYTEFVGRVEALSIKQRLILNQLEREVGNFRVALRWALAHDPEPGLYMIGDLGSCWRIRGYLTEGMTWAQQLLFAGQQASASAQARAYASTAVLASVLGHRVQARQMAKQAWLLAQQVADQPTRAQAIFVYAAMLVAPDLSLGEYDEIVLLTNEAARLFAAIGHRMNYARCFNLLGEVKRMQQHYAEAKADYLESLQGLRAVDYQSGVAIVLANLGWTVYHMGDYQAAFAYFTESINLAYDLEFSNGVAVALIGAAGALVHLEQPQQAAKLLGASEAIQKTLGMAIASTDEPDYEQTRQMLQNDLGKADFGHYSQAGRSLTADEIGTILNRFSFKEQAGRAFLKGV